MTQHEVHVVAVDALGVGEQLVGVEGVVTVVDDTAAACRSTVTDVRVLVGVVEVVAEVVRTVDGELEAFEEDDVHISAGVHDIALVEVVVPEGLGYDMTAEACACTALVPLINLLAGNLVEDVGTVCVVLVDRIDRTDVAGEVERVDITGGAVGVGDIRVSHGTGEVQTGLEPLAGLDVDVDAGVDTLEVGLDGVALLVEVADRHEEVGLLTCAGCGHRVLLAVTYAADSLLPVEVVGIEQLSVGVQDTVSAYELVVSYVERVVHQLLRDDVCGSVGACGGHILAGAGDIGVTQCLPSDGNILESIQAIVLGNTADAEALVDLDIEGHPLAAALLGGHEDDTVCCTVTVQCAGSGILEDGDGLDIVRVEVGDAVERHTVDNVQRRRTCVDGAETADADSAGITRLTGSGGELHAGCRTFECVGHVGDRTALDLLVVEGGSRSGEVLLGRGTEGHDDGLVEHLGIGCKNNVDDAPACNFDFLVEIANAGNDQLGCGRHLVKGESTVLFGGCSCHGTLDHNACEGDGLAIGVGHLTGDSTLCE